MSGMEKDEVRRIAKTLFIDDKLNIAFREDFRNFDDTNIFSYIERSGVLFSLLFCSYFETYKFDYIFVDELFDEDLNCKLFKQLLSFQSFCITVQVPEKQGKFAYI